MKPRQFSSLTNEAPKEISRRFHDFPRQMLAWSGPIHYTVHVAYTSPNFVTIHGFCWFEIIYASIKSSRFILMTIILNLQNVNVRLLIEIRFNLARYKLPGINGHRCLPLPVIVTVNYIIYLSNYYNWYGTSIERDRLTYLGDRRD